MGSDAQPIKIAILAMGGEGGGVLADWIVGMGEHNGWLAQTTSVPGVAQRTGATIYYVELFPKAAAEAVGASPVLALMPTPGDVDVVLASELMEAARAVQRGLVTPDRTTLIASTHRVYAITEKIAMGDGRSDPDALLGHARRSARRFVAFDMAQAADDAGSVISAVLFGALAGTGALPFSRAQYEATIERAGVGVTASLAAFGEALARAGQEPAASVAEATPAMHVVAPAPGQHPQIRALLDRVAALPAALQGVATIGVRRLVDYQDPAYARLYLDRLATLQKVTGHEQVLEDTARHLALWMSYEDTIRVAELKIRDTRFARVRAEVRATPGQIIAIDEYLHPRVQEVAESLPAGLGRWLLASGTARRWLERWTGRGRVVTTSSVRGYLQLWLVAGLKPWRRSTLRYETENGRIEAWLAEIAAVAAAQPELAAEIARCQRLVKGYGDTHARGWRNFERVMQALERQAGLAPAVLCALREAALADDQGHQLDAALERHALV
jgi:indolepyruvate ferredoxin oxidoreductase beta subunit